MGNLVLVSLRDYQNDKCDILHTYTDEDTNKLIDCSYDDIDKINIKNNITGKKIKSVEVMIKVASDNQNQK